MAGTYMTQKSGEREASVACKGKHLARSGGYQTNGAAEGHYGDNDRHDCGTSMRASGTEKDLNARLSSGPMNGVIDVTNAEAKGQDHDEARKTAHSMPWGSTREASLISSASMDLADVRARFRFRRPIHVHG